MKRRFIPSALAAASVLALGLAFTMLPAVASAHASIPQPQRIYHGAPRIKGHATAQSTNWSGYAVTGATGAFTTVAGSWVEPTVSCTSRRSAYSSFWVGIDGFNSNSVEQLGTDSDCAGRSPRYYAWWEMFPNPSVTLSTSSFPVSPGDTLSASVTRSGTSYTLHISSSRGWTFNTTQSGSFSNSSAEWIAEAPSSCSFTCTVLPLANFGTMSFSSSTANGSTIASYGSSVWQEITMVTNTGIVKAQPSALGSDGESFSDTWHHS